jgi:Uma2 family endonuclease
MPIGSTETVDLRQHAARPAEAETAAPPPLNSGDRLSRAEFERRYNAHPEIKKAELVEGVAYVSSPVRVQHHGEPHAHLTTWAGVYAAATSGVRLTDNATLRLDFENEVQPDVALYLEPAYGGKAHITEDDYLEGAPELVVEVAASSAAYDLHDKRRAYARNGVQEYLVLQVYEQRIDWFALREGVYEPLVADDQGLLRSQVFPGLWLQPAALWAGNLGALLAALQQGLESEEHAAFVARLREKR